MFPERACLRSGQVYGTWRSLNNTLVGVDYTSQQLTLCLAITQQYYTGELCLRRCNSALDQFDLCSA